MLLIRGLRGPGQQGGQSCALWHHEEGFQTGLSGDMRTSFLRFLKTMTALSLGFQILDSCVCPWRNSSMRTQTVTTYSGILQATTVVFVFFLFLVSTPVPGVGKGPRAWAEKLDMRQPLQFPWETKNIFPALWMRKLKQREKTSEIFQRGGRAKSCEVKAYS